MPRVVFLTGNKDKLEWIYEWKKYFEQKKWNAEILLLDEDKNQGRNQIQEMVTSQPDFVVGFNLEGFQVRMYGGDSYFNTLYCPFVTFLTRELDDKMYAKLKERCNISFVFFSVFEADVQVIRGHREQFPYVGYIKKLEKDWLLMQKEIQYAIEWGWDGEEGV